MTGLLLLTAAAGVSVGVVIGALIASRWEHIDNDSYWRGFADGEHHGRETARIPSEN